MTDAQLFWDWAIFALALWLVIPFALVWLLPKLNVPCRAAPLYRACLAIALVSILLPTQFPLLWRIYWGASPLVADLHLIELNQQVAVGTLCAVAVLLYELSRRIARLLTSNALAAALRRETSMLFRLSRTWTGRDAVE